MLGRRAERFHDLMNGVGAHEIIAETPRHDRSLHEFEIGEICDVIRAYIARMVDLADALRADLQELCRPTTAGETGQGDDTLGRPCSHKFRRRTLIFSHVCYRQIG